MYVISEETIYEICTTLFFMQFYNKFEPLITNQI